MNWCEMQKLCPQVTRAQCEADCEEVGYEEERLHVLDRHIQRMIDEKRIWSGSYCLWRKGKVFADAAIGTPAREWQGRERFLPDTMFEIQSAGKVFTAVAILKLMEDGVLYLGQPVREWIGEFDRGDFRHITIRHLLTHTSGLCALEGKYPQDERRWWEYMDESRPGETWLEAVVSAGLHCRPDEKWLYSTAGYYVLGEIIRRAAGMEAEDYIREVIFLPCGMTEIHWRREGREEQIRRYNIANETDLRMAQESEQRGILHMAQPTGPCWNGIPHTAGGQMATGREMIRFGEMILRDGYYRGTRVIGKKALSLLWTDLLGEEIKDCTHFRNVPIRYGAGVPIYSVRTDPDQILSEHTILHEGAGTCVFLVDRQEDFAAVFQTSFRKEFDWCPDAVKGTASIIWSGLRQG